MENNKSPLYVFKKPLTFRKIFGLPSLEIGYRLRNGYYAQMNYKLCHILPTFISNTRKSDLDKGWQTKYRVSETTIQKYIEDDKIIAIYSDEELTEFIQDLIFVEELKK